MSKAHFLAPQAVLREEGYSVRLGASGGKFNQLDVGKFVKLAGESMYDLCAVGDPIEGVVLAVETAQSANQMVGTMLDDAVLFVTADGLQATPGTGVIAIGDYVVTGTVVAKNTGLATSGVGGLPKVCKATLQPGVAPADLTAAGNLVKQSMFGWRVESLGTVGTGAVGTTITIRRVNA
jgi:hypothetical protein